MNKLPILPTVGGCLFVDSGAMDSLSTCKRYYEYRSLYKRVPAGDAPARAFGHAIHAANEYRYLHMDDLDAEGIDQVQHEILRREFALNPTPPEDWRNMNWALEVVHHYNTKYRLEPFNVLRYDKPIKCPKCKGTGEERLGPPIVEKPAAVPCIWCRGSGLRETMVEVPFALPFYFVELNRLQQDWFTPKEWKAIATNLGMMVLYSGRIDLPVMWDNQLNVIDFKTTSMFGPAFFMQIRVSAQQRGYVWAFKKLLGKLPFGYCISGIRSKEPPAYVANRDTAGRKSCSPEQWWDESFQRERVPVTQEQIDEWEYNTQHLLDEFLYDYSRGYLPMSTAWCTRYNHCQYYEVCTMRQADRLEFLSTTDFIDNNWSPLEEPSQPTI